MQMKRKRWAVDNFAGEQNTPYPVQQASSVVEIRSGKGLWAWEGVAVCTSGSELRPHLTCLAGVGRSLVFMLYFAGLDFARFGFGKMNETSLRSGAKENNSVTKEQNKDANSML